jgi:molybdate-binding protein/DNA-binding XRE family transcriptional regulator
MISGTTRVENRLAELRKSRGLGASDLARRVSISRQTIYAIEAGTYVPNTEVALHLARELEVTVDELFTLQQGTQPAAESLAADLLSSSPAVQGQPVRICQVDSRWVSVPVSPSPYYMPEADGIIQRLGRSGSQANLAVFSKADAAQKRLVLAGCDPATSLLSHMVETISGIEVVCAAASSKLALAWLKAGKVHIAGSHLEDPKTGEFNMPYIRQEFSGEEISVVTFARWEEGLVTARGNPKGVRKIDDLGKSTVRFINREPGSGSRALLDRSLKQACLDSAKIKGYERVAFGHLAVAYCVATGDADACLATRSAAQAFGLDFTALRSERYDLVMRKRTIDLPAVKAFLDVLQRATLRRKLEVLAGYDTSQTGTLVA